VLDKFSSDAARFDAFMQLCHTLHRQIKIVC
jgi:hypothetical protein